VVPAVDDPYDLYLEEPCKKDLLCTHDTKFSKPRDELIARAAVVKHVSAQPGSLFVARATKRSLGGAVPPVEHPQGAQGVEPARRPGAALAVEVDAAGVDAVEQPSAVGLPLRSHDVHGLRHPGIKVCARPAEVVERT